jgi:hypothetical protein
MSTLTAAAALVIASVCQPIEAPGFPRLLVDIAQGESGLRMDAVSPPNKDGTRDYGLMQINETNFRAFGVTARDLLDERPVAVRGVVVPRGPCESMRIAAAVYRQQMGEISSASIEAIRRVLAGLSGYNSGHPTRSLPYAVKILTGGTRGDFAQAARTDTSARLGDTGNEGLEQDIYDEPGE